MLRQFAPGPLGFHRGGEPDFQLDDFVFFVTQAEKFARAANLTPRSL